MNKKRILCLVDKYYPESSANTLCASFVMKKFIDEGYSVDFMSIKEDINSPTVENKGGHIVYKFENYITKNLRAFGKIFKVREWKDTPSYFRKAIGLFNIIKSPSRPNTELIKLDHINYKLIINPIESQNIIYDAVVAFSYPFAFQFLAKKIVEKNLAKKLFAILLDPFVFNYTFNPKKLERRKKVAQKALASVDKIFMTRGIKEENLKKGFDPYYHKNVVVIELPNLIEHKEKFEKEKYGGSEIVLSYAGKFYKDIRNPEKMLDILSQMSKGIVIKIIGEGCDDILKEKAKLFDNNLELLGKLPYVECRQRLISSNILINLGNTIPNQTPSKVFEYIAFGKPIINFYFNEEDTSLYYLKKYPLCFNLNLNNYGEKDVNNLREFINKEKNKNMSFEEATADLVESRSENVVNKIYEEINKEI